MSDISEVIDDQIEQQGTASIQVKDGEVFVFTRETLEALLARALESGTGRVAVFVRRGARA